LVLKLFRFLNVNEYAGFPFKIGLKPDDKSQFAVFLPIPLVSSGGSPVFEIQYSSDTSGSLFNLCLSIEF
jgi:hypothetical protein